MSAQPDLFSYPLSPGSKERGGTSEEAAESIAPRAYTLRGRALNLLRREYPAGLTADEIAERCGETVLAMRPRVTELGKLGLIQKTSLCGRNTSGMRARVWRAVV